MEGQARRETQVGETANGKRSQEVEGDAEKSNKKGKGSGFGSRPKCQVQDCGQDLTGAKDYYKRHRVCEQHSKARSAIVLGVQQRFCQQCSRFHVLGEFDEAKRSCRRRLQGHNERRRKTSCDTLVIRSDTNHHLNGSWLNQREETERVSMVIDTSARAKLCNKIKNH
eukprot:TRINITY_DN7929_c0_g1_i2.p1 TRINITY_DN7929_c0_g1~~TRINITY_DN7929_c0_g1_i2.p1  ORF type:complete len:195 (+),score=23.65 TRINITY_DN7929_c0_g1_i2:82-585(+)